MSDEDARPDEENENIFQFEELCSDDKDET
jgi:hypothetical protein